MTARTPVQLVWGWVAIAVVSGALVPEDEFKVSLYDVKDPIVQLSNENFKDSVYGQPVALLVEFYSSWCGHCVHFAPTWLQFSKEIVGWNRVVKPAAINCGVDENMPTCREFSVDSFPSLLYFNYMATGVKDGKLIKDSHNDVPEIKALLIDQLQRDQLLNGPKNWPRLRNVESSSKLVDMWNLAELSDANRLVVVVAPEKDRIGAEIALDLSNLDKVFVVTVNSDSDLAVSHKILKYPAVLLFDRSHKGLLYQSTDKETRESIRDKVLQSFKIAGQQLAVVPNDEHSTEAVTVKSELKTVDPSALSSPYARDLLSGLHNLLTREIPQHKHMDETHVRAVKNFLKLLIAYFPHALDASGLVKKCLEDMYAWTMKQAVIEGEDWSAKVAGMEAIEKLKPIDQSSRWVSCMGSEKKYRGYSCSLWLMFHTITVHYYLSPTAGDSDGPEILEAIRDYIVNFFGCRVCGEHFKTECQSIREEVRVKKDVVLWLWETHNRVNKRLSGDKHEDPQHPKIQFPSSVTCESCNGPRGRFDRERILGFLVDHYSHFRMGDAYQPGRLLNVHQTGKLTNNSSPEDRYWLLTSLSSLDLSLCLLLWVVSIGVVMFFCYYFKCWRNPASKKLVRYIVGSNKHFKYVR